jgi:hypothetical protein
MSHDDVRCRPIEAPLEQIAASRTSGNRTSAETRFGVGLLFRRPL